MKRIKDIGASRELRSSYALFFSFFIEKDKDPQKQRIKKHQCQHTEKCPVSGKRAVQGETDDQKDGKYDKHR